MKQPASKPKPRTPSHFAPKFPPSIDGRWRTPLLHVDFEALGRRMDALYSSASLDNTERADLIRAYRHLRKAEGIFLGPDTYFKIPDTNFRPHTPEQEGGTGLEMMRTNGGYFYRVKTWITGLEQKYQNDPVPRQDIDVNKEEAG